jgi:alanine dehydrogenase
MSEHVIVTVSEAVCQQVLTRADAFDAVEAVFGAMARGDARNFPVVREALAKGGPLYGFKSGYDARGQVLGVKSGGYFPGNDARGLTNHQSVIALFDPVTGRLNALVGGNYLTAIRTAAASAISIKHLARANAKILGMVGAGHQSTFQLRAAAEQRAFDRVVAWNHHPDMLPKLAAVAAEIGLPFAAVDRETLCAEADVIITITSAFEPLLKDAWIRPGTHLACMGTDTEGKQEVDANLLARAQVFTDEVAQSTSIGEAQHAIALGLIGADDITALGRVINGDHPGRRDAQAITLFDGTGVGLQDLATAAIALARATEAGLAGRATL